MVSIIRMFSAAALRARCAVAFVKNLVLRRRLVVEKIDLFPLISVVGSKQSIRWLARGCHRIEISNVGTFPGTIDGVELMGIGPIEIRFFGIRQRVTKDLYPFQLNMELSFPRVKADMQSLSAADYALNSFLIRLPKIQVGAILTELPSLAERRVFVKLDQFNRENYVKRNNRKSGR